MKREVIIVDEHDGWIKRPFRSLESMTIDELLQEKIVVDDALSRVKGQLEDARRRAATDGEYSDRDWYSRARGAVRMFGTRSQKIQARLAQLKREQKQGNFERSNAQSDRFKHVFMRLVRERLGDAQYLELCALAREESEAEEKP
jgi:predicted HNH restriction endonuclease